MSKRLPDRGDEWFQRMPKNQSSNSIITPSRKPSATHKQSTRGSTSVSTTHGGSSVSGRTPFDSNYSHHIDYKQLARKQAGMMNYGYNNL